MANDLAELRLWLQVMLMDLDAKSWSTDALDVGLRMALMEISKAAGVELAIKDLNNATATTLATVDRSTLLLGAGGYAVRARALDLSEKAAIGDNAISTMLTYAKEQLDLYNGQLLAIGRRSLQKSTAAPFSALYWDEEDGSSASSAPVTDNTGTDTEGSDGPMQRENKTVAAVIASGNASSAVIDLTWAAGAGLVVPSALDATTAIAFKVSDSLAGTFLPLYDEFNVLVEIPVTLNAAKAYALPDSLFAWPYFKLWAEAARVDVQQTSDRAFSVVMKS